MNTISPDKIKRVGLKRTSGKASRALGDAIFHIRHLANTDPNFDMDSLNISIEDLEELDSLIYCRYHED